MIHMKLIMDGDGVFPDAKDEDFGEISALARLPNGMTSGKSSVCVEITVGGKKYYGQTSMRLLEQAVGAFKARDDMEAASGKHTH